MHMIFKNYPASYYKKSSTQLELTPSCKPKMAILGTQCIVGRGYIVGVEHCFQGV